MPDDEYKNLAADNIAAAATAFAMGTALSGNPLTGGGLAIAMLAPVFENTLALGIRRLFGRRAGVFTEGYAKPFGSAESAKAHAEAHQTDEAYQQTMYQSFRSMMDAVDESVVETLGYLAGQYAHRGQKPDAYFRSLGRLLCDLEEGELTDLRNMLRQIPRLEPNPEANGLVEVLAAELVDSEINVVMHQRRGTEVLLRSKSALKLLRLLRRVGFTQEGPTPWGNGGGRITPIDSAQIHRDVVVKILATIDPQPT